MGTKTQTDCVYIFLCLNPSSFGVVPSNRASHAHVYCLSSCISGEWREARRGLQPAWSSERVDTNRKVFRSKHLENCGTLKRAEEGRRPKGSTVGHRVL